MDHLATILIMHLQEILRHGGYWVIGLVSFLEALPLIGTVIPGHTIVIFGGFFAHLGFLNVYYVAFWAAVGALGGDLTSFYLGKKYGLNMITQWGKYFLLKQQHIDKAREALNKHSGKAILIGRFNPIARVFIPFLAGASGMRIRKFWVFAAIGSIAWAIVAVVIGYVFGASYQLIAHSIGKFTTIGIVIALLIAAAYYFINQRRHIFAKYDFHLLLVCLVSVYIFFKTVQDVVVVHPFMAQLDVAINIIMAAHIIPWLVEIAKIASDIFSPTTLTVAAVAMGCWWFYKKHWHNVYILVAAYPVGLVFGYLLKIAVGRSRPINMLVPETSFSFPSGHALAAALFFILIMYFFTKRIKSRYLRELFIVGNALVIALVCASRIYLNVHWFSDVLAGLTFGIFWVTFSILVVHYMEGLTRGRNARQLK